MGRGETFSEPKGDSSLSHVPWQIGSGWLRESCKSMAASACGFPVHCELHSRRRSPEPGTGAGLPGWVTRPAHLELSHFSSESPTS